VYRRWKVGLVGALLIISMSLLGCGGGGARAAVEAKTTTKGQELLDLKKALDQGIITQKEYDKQKKQILKRN
jgi:hypothetical protein